MRLILLLIGFILLCGSVHAQRTGFVRKKNEHFVNPTGQSVVGVRKEIHGQHHIFGMQTDTFENTEWGFTGGETRLTWTGNSLGAGECAHVCFEYFAPNEDSDLRVDSFEWLYARAQVPPPGATVSCKMELVDGGDSCRLSLGNFRLYDDGSRTEAPPVFVDSLGIAFIDVALPMDRLVYSEMYDPESELQWQSLDSQLLQNWGQWYTWTVSREDYQNAPYAVIRVTLTDSPSDPSNRNHDFIEWGFDPESTNGIEGLTTTTMFDPRVRAVPTPFRNQTEITFYVPSEDEVMISIHSVDGRRICDLVNRPYSRGEYRVTWNGRATDGTPVPAGVYFSRIDVAGRTDMSEIVLLR